MVVGRIVNSSRGIYSDKWRLLPGTAFYLDVAETMQILREKDWLSHEYCVLDSKDGQERWGLVFADLERLNTLARHGHLTLFHATHKLNKWKYYV